MDNAEYRAIYKCRLCGKTFSDSLISEEEAEKCLMAFEKGKTYYLSRSGRNNVSKQKGHYYCKDGSFGFAGFQGFKKFEDNAKYYNEQPIESKSYAVEETE